VSEVFKKIKLIDNNQVQYSWVPLAQWRLFNSTYPFRKRLLLFSHKHLLPRCQPLSITEQSQICKRICAMKSLIYFVLHSNRKVKQSRKRKRQIKKSEEHI